MQLVTDLRPWRLRDFHWGADGRGLVLVLEDANGQRQWLAWLDLRANAITRLTTELSGDTKYAGQTNGGKLRVMAAVRPSSARSVLQAVTPTGEVVAGWNGPGPPVTWCLANQTRAIAVCTTVSTCTWWHSQLSEHAWSPVAEFPAADARASRPLAFSSADQALFATSSAGRDTIALIRLAPPAWAPVVLSASERFDVTSVLMSPDGSGPDLVTTTDPTNPQSALTEVAGADLSRLVHLAGGAPARIIGRNESHCLAEVCYPVGGPAYVTFSRKTKAVSKPLVRYTGLGRVRIHPRRPFSFRARDGELITAFMTRPQGAPPWPLVLDIHDGPWARDGAHMDPWSQYLASAGFCIVQVNYRGSRGFGKKFRDAGLGQWSLTMQDDLVDALRSAQVRAVADPSRVTAMGHGYGGYAALMLATQPDIAIAAAISASAPTDLVRYTSSLLSFGGGSGYAYAAGIGHPVQDRDKLTSASPMARIADICVPLLLFHGRQDARVAVSHATTFADSLHRADKPHELIIYEDEGHWYSRPQNVANFRMRTVDFLLSSLAKPADSALR
jgi:dipeptidyl aminopeptidase/acylaminoacyl peptidase